MAPPLNAFQCPSAAANFTTALRRDEKKARASALHATCLR
jgi:hypothetical protein